VEAIVTAAAQVLIEYGYEGATTARIAERAGVSIGSLYQYFPNKESLVAVLIEEHATEIVEIMQEALDDPRHVTLIDGLKAAIRAGTVAHRVHPALHKILHEQVPRIGRLGTAMDTERRITNAIEAFLIRHDQELPPGTNHKVMAFVIETVIEALVHKAVIDQYELFSEGIIEREALRLITNYISAPATASAVA